MSSLISVFVTSPDTHSERRFDTNLTVAQLKDKLTPITGISPHYQTISLLPSTDSTKISARLDDDARSLASYGVSEWNCIKVDNLDPNARPGEFSDLSAVEKFELTPEEYEARSDTVLSHLKSHKLGRFAPQPTNLTHQPPPPQSAPSSIIPGARCEVVPSKSETSEEGLRKRGTVRFVGLADIGKGGIWIGVEVDEPVGKGDGSDVVMLLVFAHQCSLKKAEILHNHEEIDGKRYFTCPPLHAIFVRPDRIEIGDFPEEDLMASDDEI